MYLDAIRKQLHNLNKYYLQEKCKSTKKLGDSQVNLLKERKGKYNSNFTWENTLSLLHKAN